jgi:uncharacterized protein YjiK
MTIKESLQRVAIFGALAALPILTFAQQGVLQTFPLTRESMRQWKLPDRLNEISGLALSPDGRLFAVADEDAAIYELDYDEGRVVKAFAFGKPVQRGDFEGIAILDDLFWLTTSSGEIFSGPEGADGEQMAFQRFRTNLGSKCEIEGLAADQKSRSLSLVCKKLSKGSDLEGLAIFNWSVQQQQVIAENTVLLPVRKIRRRLNTDKFNPSGITVVPTNGNFVIVASRQRALVEITPDGELVTARKFELVSRHRQPEGIELTRDARLLISDEGGHRRARLAVYWQEGVQIDHE